MVSKDANSKQLLKRFKLDQNNFKKMKTTTLCNLINSFCLFQRKQNKKLMYWIHLHFY